MDQNGTYGADVPELSDTHGIAAKLVDLQTWLADATDVGEIDRTIPGVRLCISPGRDAPFPSSNPNRADSLPASTGWSGASPARCIGRFAQAGVRHFFFWVSPSGNSGQIEHDLLAAGFTRFAGTRYIVLARPVEAVTVPATSFAIRRLDPKREAAAIAAYENDEVTREVISTADLPQVEHFMAFDGDHPAAYARLATRGGMAHLCAASTREPCRNRGAQSALIAARLNRAAELGCTMATAQTLAFLQTSLNNLQRRGFEPLFEKRVFEWTGPAAGEDRCRTT
jgi:GNAT superfamily N-acetyltransferase